MDNNKEQIKDSKQQKMLSVLSKDKKKNIFKRVKNIFSNETWMKLYSLFIIPFLLFLLYEVFYKLCNVSYARTLWFPGLIFSFLIFLGIYYVFLGLLNNTYRTSVTISIILIIFGIANQLKISYSDDPLFLSDILFVNSASTFFDILKDTVFDLLKKYFILIALFLVGIIYICKLAKIKNELTIKKRFRVFFILIPIAILTFISLPIKSVNDSVLTIFFNKQNRQNKYATTNMGYYFKFGVFSGLYGQMVENRLVKPDDYSDEQLETVLSDNENNSTDNTEKKLGTPNIVMIFSESFWDIDDMTEVTFDKAVASNFNKLASKGILFDMISPSYGGISCNVEYEMLTGSSIKFFSPGYMPYMQLYRDDKYYKSPSIIHELENNGYTTHISSTWESTLFNCEKVYEYFGVDKVDYKEDMKDAYEKGGRISDKYIGERIIKELSEKPKGEKLFTMTLTAQAHMPFPKDKYSKYDISIKKSSLSKAENDTILSYAQGVYDADQQLKVVYDYIQTMDEPTILIFYGDHLPYLKTEDGEDITKKLNYFNSGNKEQDLYNRYHTKCLVLSNYDIGGSQNRYLGPDLVMPYLMSQMDVKLSPYYKWLNTTIDTLPACNLYVAVDNQGNKYLKDDLSGSMKECFDLREKMNWKFFIDVNVNNNDE